MGDGDGHNQHSAARSHLIHEFRLDRAQSIETNGAPFVFGSSAAVDSPDETRG